MSFPITPPMSPARAHEIAASFDLRALPTDFLANPYPVYAALREREPVRRMPDGSVFLTRCADLMAVYQQGIIDLEGVQAVQLAMIAHAELMGTYQKQK